MNDLVKYPNIGTGLRQYILLDNGKLLKLSDVSHSDRIYFMEDGSIALSTININKDTLRVSEQCNIIIATSDSILNLSFPI